MRLDHKIELQRHFKGAKRKALSNQSIEYLTIVDGEIAEREMLNQTVWECDGEYWYMNIKRCRVEPAIKRGTGKTQWCATYQLNAVKHGPFVCLNVPKNMEDE